MYFILHANNCDLLILPLDIFHLTSR